MVFQQFSHMKSTAAPRAPRGFASTLSWAAVPNSAGEVVKGVQELEGAQGPTWAPRSLIFFGKWHGWKIRFFFGGNGWTPTTQLRFFVGKRYPKTQNFARFLTDHWASLALAR